MTQTSTLPSKSKNRRVGWIIAAIVVFVPLIAVGYSILTMEEDVSRLKRPAYEAAMRKWEDSGIMNYNLDLAFSGGDQVRQIHLEVRDGQATQCLENGHAPTQRGTWDDWTINNQFAMIGDDLNKAERPEGFAVRGNVTITLHANFDPKYGFPRTYHRKARGNTPLQSKWQVQDFQIVDDKATSGGASK